MSLRNYLRNSLFGKNISLFLNFIRMLKFKPNLKFLNIEKKNNKKKKILFASSVGMNPDFYFGSIIAKSLNNQGHHVKTLICDGKMFACFNCKFSDFSNVKLMKSLNFNGPKSLCKICYNWGKKIIDNGNLDHFFYSDFFKYSELKPFFIKIDNIKSIKKLKNFKYKGINVGDHSFAASVRFFANPNLELEKGHLYILKSYVKSSLITVEVLKKINKVYNFEYLLIDHGIYVPQGIILEFCRKYKKNITTYAASAKNKTFLFSKNQSYHYEFVKKIDLSKITMNKKRKKITFQNLNHTRFGKHDWITFQEKNQKEKIKFSNNKINIAIFTNVLWDARVHFKDSVFETCEKWIIETIELVKNLNLSNIHLHIRIHPGEEKGFVKSRYFLAPIVQNYLHKNKIKFVSLINSKDTINSYDLADACDFSICYSSKIAIELAAFGKKVITTGDSWTKNKNITHDIKNKIEYKKVLKNINDKKYYYKSNQNNALKFAYYLNFELMKKIDFLEKKSGNPPYKINLNKIKKDNSINRITNFILN